MEEIAADLEGCIPAVGLLYGCSMGKAGGLKLLEKAFSTDEYSREDLKYFADVLRFMSYKTIWRTFETCNNYDMPEEIIDSGGRLLYWYGEKERPRLGYPV